MEYQNFPKKKQSSILNENNKNQSEQIRQNTTKRESSNIFLPNNSNLRTNIKGKLFSHINTTILHTQNSYVNWGLTKQQPELSRTNFPYCLDDEETVDEKKKLMKTRVKITNKVRGFNKENLKENDYKNRNIEKQEPPVNEYLSYDLSQQITQGIYDVKILAEEIKKIKKEKQTILEEKEKPKPMNKIRIKKQSKIRGSWFPKNGKNQRKT